MYNRETRRAEEAVPNPALLHSVGKSATYMLDAGGAVSTWNQEARLAKGYTADEILGKDFSVFYTAEDQKSREPSKGLSTAIEVGRYESEGWRACKDGSRFWGNIVISPIYKRSTLTGFAIVTRNISHEHEVDERSVRTDRNLEIALANMCQGLALYDVEGRLILSNDRLHEMFSIPADRIQIGMSVADVMRSIGFSTRRSMRMQNRIESLRPTHHSDHVQEANMFGRVISISTQPMPEGGWASTFQDITDSRKTATRLEHLANHDSLTGLPNRKQFRMRLKEAVARMNRGVSFALLIVDINDFTTINDTLGRAAGDELLCSFAQRMKQQIREVDTIARLDGDEFAIIQQGAEDPRDTQVLAHRLIEDCGIPHVIDGHSVIVRLNVGIALGPRDGADADDILKKADLALRSAKQLHVPSYNFFDPELDRELQSRRALENDLSCALANNEFQLYYQPQADAQTGKVIGYEALLRWHHPTRGSIAPAEFIPIAEQSGLIVSIGEWVLRTACEEASRWPRHLRVAVNLSAVQFKTNELAEIVAETLRSSGLESPRLELEITESLLLQDNESNLGTLSRLRKIGVRIALDDFGIGYSSLNYLCRFHVDKLKIDRSFVMALPDSTSARMIVAAIIQLANSFNINVTAEGVETLQQLEFLRACGCKEVQGFLIGRPQPTRQHLDTTDSPAFREASTSLIPATGFC